MKHTAIYKTHPEIVSVDDTAGAFDKDGNIVEIDWVKVEAAKKQLEIEAAQLEQAIQNKRAAALLKLEALGLDEDDLKALGL